MLTHQLEPGCKDEGGQHIIIFCSKLSDKTNLTSVLYVNFAVAFISSNIFIQFILFNYFT